MNYISRLILDLIEPVIKSGEDIVRHFTVHNTLPQEFYNSTEIHKRFFINQRHAGWMNLVHIAGLQDNLDVLKVILQYCYDINAQSLTGYTALDFTTSYDVAKYLIVEGKASSNIKDIVGLTSLAKAYNLEKYNIVCLMLEHGANIDHCTDRPVVQDFKENFLNKN